jgi:hypothetical protein
MDHNCKKVYEICLSRERFQVSTAAENILRPNLIFKLYPMKIWAKLERLKLALGDFGGTKSKRALSHPESSIANF